MKRVKRYAALMIALLMTMSVCISNGSMVALATGTSSDMETEDVVEENDRTMDEGEILESDKMEDIDKTDSKLQPEDESTEDDTALNIEAIEEVVRLFEALPTASDLEDMTTEELNEVVQQTQNAMDVFDALNDEECEYIIENYSELYNAVADELCSTLAVLMQDGVAPMSLLPLEEVKAYLVLSGYAEDELKSMSVDTMLNLLKDYDGNAIDIEDNATTVWRYTVDDSGIEGYEKYNIGQNETINIYPGGGIETFQLEIIVGNDGQLNRNNKRYIIKIYLNENFEDDIDVEIYLQSDDNTRTQAIPNDCKEWVFEYSDGVTEELIFDLSFGESITGALADHGTVWLNIKSKLAEDPRVTVEIYPVIVYENSYVTVKKPIADQVLNQNMEVYGAGYQISGEKNTDETFQIVTYVDGKEYSKKYIGVRYWNWYPCHEGTLFSKQDNVATNIFEELSTGFDAKTHVSEIVFELEPDLSDNDKYYFNYDFVMQKNFGGTGDATNYDRIVKKVVIGHYDSIEEAEAAGAIDVTGDILNNGYLADYSGMGMNFTVFKYDRLSQSFPLIYDTLADKINVRVVKNHNSWREFTDTPIIGEADPWFRIIGVSNINNDAIDSYIIENGKSTNIDTMYGYGYQTIFINQDIDSFIPTFWRANDEAISIDKIFANGSEFKEGSVLSFPAGKNTLNATFSVVIKDKNGAHPKNYDVTFVKKASEPQLYVAGPLAPDVRSVFLDEHHENKHDIFIANIGNAPLTDLWLDLDATNVELDNYWTIGGAGNNTLAACPKNFSVELDSTAYGELSNVAKIRLVPPSTGKGGEIKGTLKIYSGEEGNSSNSELLATINLSDLAQNPEIITAKLDDAVKYVPYSYLITTNNMYDWVNVSYKITDGDLPAGIELIEETGELYGVPKETGTFKFSVTTQFESTSENYAFKPSSVELTLTVNDNTDDNVFNATDVADNYSILDAIGADNAGDHHYVLEEYSDKVFRSEGKLGQFVDVWLNGEKLVRDVDYTVEDGSTKITVKSQTFQGNKTNKGGQRNTIAAEFRTKDTGSKNDKNNSNELKRTSQNFYTKEHMHSYDAGIITKAATCSETGVRTYTCKSCGHKSTETIAALGHFPGEKKVIKTVTCMENGENAYYCTRCNILMRTEVIVAQGHDYVATVIQDGDCKTDGIKTHTCRNCGDSYTETIKAAGHKYVVEVTIEPTETTDGLRTFTCSVCHDQFTEIIPALGDGTHLHTYDEGVVTKKATCLENGMMTYTCTQCGAVKQETILASGHKYNEEIITEVTCTESGLKKHTCEYCGDSYMETIVAKGHSYDDGVVTKQATDMETGIMTYTCTVCGSSYTVVTPMINSSFVQDGTGAEIPDNQVACIVHLLNINGEAIGGMPMELHSTPRYLTTDVNGYARFGAVDFGTHELYVVNDNGAKVSKEFRLVSGTATFLNGDTVTAEPGTSVIMTAVFDGTSLEIVGVEKNSSPKTGDNSVLILWYIMLFASFSCIAAAICFRGRLKYIGQLKRYLK